MSIFIKDKMLPILLGAFLSVFLLYSCKTDIEEPKEASVIHVRVKKDPLKLSPILKASAKSRLIFQYIMPAICNYNPFSLELEPILLESLPESTTIDSGEYKGMTRMHMEIKQNAVWPDGTPITAKDYVFTVKAGKHPTIQNTSWRIYLKDLVDVVIDQNDNRHFDVIVKGDYFLSYEMMCSLELYPQHIYNPSLCMDRISIPELNNSKLAEKKVLEDTSMIQFAKNFNSKKFYKETVVGFGPYSLKEWESDQYISLVKNPNYWGNNDSSFYLQGYPDEIIFHIIPDEINAISQFKNGQIDVLTGISSTSYNQLKQDESIIKNYNFFSPNTMKQYYIGLNNRSEFFQDLNIRKAMAYSVDVDALINILEYNEATRLNSNFSSRKKIYNKELEAIPYDPLKAIDYLNKSGWVDSDHDGYVDKTINGKKNDLVIDFLASKDSKIKQLGTILKEQAAKSGIRIEIEVKDFKVIRNKNLKNHDFDMLMLSVTKPVPWSDPYLRWHSDNIGIGKSNFFGFNNKEADEIIEQIRVSAIPEKQILLYHRLQEIMQEQQVTIPLYELQEKIIIHKKFDAKCFSKRPGYMVSSFKRNNYKNK